MSTIKRGKKEAINTKSVFSKIKVEGVKGSHVTPKLDFLIQGIEDYKFNITSFNENLLIPMTKEEILNHFYRILLNYIDADQSVNICKVFVLYAVKQYEQKEPVNSFLVSFIKHLDSLTYDNHEFQVLIEVVNVNQNRPIELKKNLRVLISIKEKLLNYYMDVSDSYHTNLKLVAVSCKDWANLFKSYNYLFNMPESVLVKKLIEKFRNDLGVINVNTVPGSTYLKAIYGMYQDLSDEQFDKENFNTQLHSRKSQVSQYDSMVSSYGSKAQNSLHPSNLTNNTFGRSLQEVFATANQDSLLSRHSMGKGALRENADGNKVFGIVNENKGNSEFKSNDDLLKELEGLDAVIYKEGREKRSRQELLDGLMGKIKLASKDYDGLVNTLVEMEKAHITLTKFAEENCPEILKQAKKPNFDDVQPFMKNKDFYMKTLNSGLIK